jgi:hypothetical protein
MNNKMTDSTTEEEKQIQVCTDTISFKYNGKRFPPQSARVPPSQRLTVVFGIDNAFTNEDPTKSNKFTKDVINKMKEAIGLFEDSEPNWTTLRGRALDYFADYMRGKDTSICLAELVQYVTLKLSFSYLFDGVNEALNSENSLEDIVYIGAEINKL